MKKITFIKERRGNIFGTFEDIDTITADYIVEQTSDAETVYCKVWDKIVAIPAKDIVSIEG